MPYEPGKQSISREITVVTFREFGMSKLIEEAITAYVGERCPDFDPECAVCQTWAEYDGLKQMEDFLQDKREVKGE